VINAPIVEERLMGPRGLVVDLATRRTHVRDHEIHLTQQGFDLLAYLLRERGRVVPNDELIRAVWGHTVVVGRHFVQTAVYRLRESLRPAGADDLVEAVRGVGYRLRWHEDDEGGRPAELGSRSEIELALRVSALPTMIIDAQQRVLFANEAMARLTGYSVEELEALPSSEVLSPPSVRERRRNDLKVLIGGATDEGWSEPVVRRDGSIVHLELFAESITMSGGAPAVLVQFWLKQGDLAALEPLWRPEPRRARREAGTNLQRISPN
jgi:PAS domain S-box-containing protein